MKSLKVCYVRIKKNKQCCLEMLISQPLLKKSAVKIHDYMWYFLHSLGIDIYIFFNQNIMFMNQSERQAKGKWNSTFVRNSIFEKKTFSVNFWFLLKVLSHIIDNSTWCVNLPTRKLSRWMQNEAKGILKQALHRNFDFFYVTHALCF